MDFISALWLSSAFSSPWNSVSPSVFLIERCVKCLLLCPTCTHSLPFTPMDCISRFPCLVASSWVQPKGVQQKTSRSGENEVRVFTLLDPTGRDCLSLIYVLLPKVAFLLRVAFLQTLGLFDLDKYSFCLLGLEHTVARLRVTAFSFPQFYK